MAWHLIFLRFGESVDFLKFVHKNKQFIQQMTSMLISEFEAREKIHPKDITKIKVDLSCSMLFLSMCVYTLGSSQLPSRLTPQLSTRVLYTWMMS